METTVVNKRFCGNNYDVYIGRPGIWQNPFPMKGEHTRQKCLEDYEAYIRQEHKLLARLPELVGKRLACWCAPKPCHGHILIKLMKERGLI